MPPPLTYLLLGLCTALFVVGFWIGGRRASARFPRLSRLSIVFQIAAVVAAYLVLRPGRGADPNAAIASSMSHDQPVMLDIYSNY